MNIVFLHCEPSAKILVHTTPRMSRHKSRPWAWRVRLRLRSGSRRIIIKMPRKLVGCAKTTTPVVLRWWPGPPRALPWTLRPTHFKAQGGGGSQREPHGAVVPWLTSRPGVARARRGLVAQRGAASRFSPNSALAALLQSVRATGPTWGPGPARP